MYRLRVERTPRAGPLVTSESRTLRRYRGHSSPRVRQAQLIWLAKTAMAEEAFFHTLPDNLWTEVGFVAEHGANPWQGYGIRILPIPALLRLWSGRVAGFRRPERVENYHNHPLLFVRKTLKRLGQPVAWDRLVDLPSAPDLFVHARIKHYFGARGIPVTSRVAIPDALVRYDVSADLQALILKSRRPGAVRTLEVYESARLSYAKHDISRAFFHDVLRTRFRQAGLPPDSVTLEFDHRMPTVG